MNFKETILVTLKIHRVRLIFGRIPMEHLLILLYHQITHCQNATKITPCGTVRKLDKNVRACFHPSVRAKKSKRAIEKQQSVPNGTSESKVVNLNRWSTTSEPPDMQNGLSETQSRNGLSETTSSHSHSDTDINYSSHDRLNAIDSELSSLRIFISYTDDAKDNVIAMATQLKQQGHQVSTDLQQMSFALAKNKGLVSEKDQYVWLSNKYNNADYVIVCLSKGYVECLNYQSACPSQLYLNAKYIFDLIVNDEMRNEKIIQVSFQNNSLRNDYRLKFGKQFIWPTDMECLNSYMTKRS